MGWSLSIFPNLVLCFKLLKQCVLCGQQCKQWPRLASFQTVGKWVKDETPLYNHDLRCWLIQCRGSAAEVHNFKYKE